jgi:hypothetical protein
VLLGEEHIDVPRSCARKSSGSRRHGHVRHQDGNERGGTAVCADAPTDVA